MALVGDTTDIPEEYILCIGDVIKQEKITEFSTSLTLASSKGENYLGLLYRIKVTGVRENGEKTKLSLILKIPPQSQLYREKLPLGTLYTREVYVYNVLLPELCALQDQFNVPPSEQFRYAKCYKASSEMLKEFLMLEDMCERDFKMADRRGSLGVKHSQLVLKNLASYHALSFVLKKVNPKLFDELTRHTGGMSDYNEQYSNYFDLSRDRALAILDDPIMNNKIKTFGVGLYSKLEHYLNPDAIKPYSVICHGDCWNNNLLYKFEDEEPVDVMLVDWQLARNCSPVTDIAYLMFTSTDYDLRKEHFENLMSYYHECLAKSLSYMDCDIEDHYPKAVFEEHIKKFLMYGLLMSFMLLPAVLGEAEDVPDVDAWLLKGKVEQSDLKFENKQSSSRYESRMRGVVRTFMEMDLI